ncbi:hypothetical protein Q3G72_000023 [Acer saccharum]|nr:hypothetical protein Q3G72_000023 [Acer saccharum]
MSLRDHFVNLEGLMILLRADQKFYEEILLLSQLHKQNGYFCAALSLVHVNRIGMGVQVVILCCSMAYLSDDCSHG